MSLFKKNKSITLDLIGPRSSKTIQLPAWTSEHQLHLSEEYIRSQLPPEAPKPDVNEEWRLTILEAIRAAKDEINASKNAEELAAAVKILTDLSGLRY